MGLINRPGPYAYVLGLTVAQAIALAGGLNRSLETTGELQVKTTLADTTSRLAEAITRRALLEAENNGSQIRMPKELAQLEPFKAHEMLAVETVRLELSRQSIDRQKSGLEMLIALKQSEVDSLNIEANRITRRIEEQTKIFSQMQKLREEKIVNVQRIYETVLALDNLQREKQANGASLSVAKANLEKAQTDLAMLTLSNKERIAKEMADTEFEITRLKRVAAQIADYQTVVSQGDSGRVAAFRIIRANLGAPGNSIQADDTTPVLPGDVIKVEVQKQTSFVAN